jgi:hypothetical protein
MRRLPVAVRFERFGSDKDREDGGVVTRAMEVLQVQPVVPRLVSIGNVVLPLTAFELDREYGRTRYQDNVDTAAEPRDVEFKID